MTKKEFWIKVNPALRLDIRRWQAERTTKDPLAARANLKAEIELKSWIGMVGLVEAGMDCDCVAYSGRVRLVPANVMAYVRAVNLAYEQAEGPISLGMVTPQQARQIRYESRDLGAEAHENGHPYSVSYRR